MAPKELTMVDGDLAHVPVTVQGCLMVQDRCWAKIWRLAAAAVTAWVLIAGMVVSSHLLLSSKTESVASKLTDRDEARAEQFNKLLMTNEEILKALKAGPCGPVTTK